MYLIISYFFVWYLMLVKELREGDKVIVLDRLIESGRDRRSSGLILCVVLRGDALNEITLFESERYSIRLRLRDSVSVSISVSVSLSLALSLLTSLSVSISVANSLSLSLFLFLSQSLFYLYLFSVSLTEFSDLNSL